MKDEISLRDYIEAILDSHDRAHAAEHKAVELAAQEMERRVEGLNQLRQDVITDRGQFVRRDLLDGLVVQNDERLAARDEKLGLLEKALDERLKPLEQSLITQASLNAYKKVLYGTLIGAGIAFAIALFNLITKT